jgi:hypothetical protein
MSENVADAIITALLVAMFWLKAILIRRETYFGGVMALVAAVLGGVFAWALLAKVWPDLLGLRVIVKSILAVALVAGLTVLLRERWMVRLHAERTRRREVW